MKTLAKVLTTNACIKYLWYLTPGPVRPIDLMAWSDLWYITEKGSPHARRCALFLRRTVRQNEGDSGLSTTKLRDLE